MSTTAGLIYSVCVSFQRNKLFSFKHQQDKSEIVFDYRQRRRGIIRLSMPRKNKGEQKALLTLLVRQQKVEGLAAA
jgi:hypothetical protein